MPRRYPTFAAGLLGLAWAVGCGEAPAPPATETFDPPAAVPSRFDATSAGTVRGRVTWSGPVPRPSVFEGWGPPLADNAPREHYVQPNPNAPVIDAQTQGVGNAVVFLRGVAPDRARPWDHPPARVEQRGRRFHVCQGGTDTPFGFVRRGDAVEMVSRDQAFHLLHADGGPGGEYFTLAFPDPGQPLARRLRRPGVVELTSAAGYFWMRAYLFVDDHPYYARTDAQGRFVLPQVPPGRYEAVCWLPNWVKARHEREPESGLVFRLFFAAPIKRTRPVVIAPRQETEANFTIQAPPGA